MRTICGEFVRHALLLFLPLIVLFPGTFLRGEVIAPSDILYWGAPWDHHTPDDWTRPRNRLMSDVLSAFHPFYHLTNRALDAGEWPLWNPLQYFGMPLLANCQSAPLYPPRLLQALLGVPFGTTLYVLLKLWLCGMTAYACGRGLGLSVPASRFFSLSYMLSSFNVIWCNWSLPDVTAWLPLLFLGVEWTLSDRPRRGFWLIACGGTLSLLAGHPETAFAQGWALGLYFLVRSMWAISHGGRFWRPAGVCAAAWVLAILVCAAQLLPFFEYLANSATFFERPGVSKIMWYPPSTALCFWIPRFFGTSSENNYWGVIDSNRDSMVYAGLTVWLGLGLLVTRGKALNGTNETNGNGRQLPDLLGVSPRTAGLVASATLGMFMAFRVPTLRFLTDHPPFNTMIHSYHSVFALFALPLLGAIGLEHWLDRPRRGRELFRLASVVLPAVAVVTAGAWFYASLADALGIQPYLDRQFLVAAGIASAGLAILFAHCLGAPKGVVAALFSLLAAGDLLYAARGLNATTPRSHLYPPTALTEYLERLPKPCRIGASEGGIASGLLVSYGIEEWNGYDGIYPARVTRFLNTLKRSVWGGIGAARAIPYYLLLDIPGVDSGIPPECLARMEPLGTHDGIQVLRDPEALPRAFLSKRLESVPDTDALFARLRDPAFDPRETAFTDAPPASSLQPPASGPIGEAEIVDYRSTRVTVHVRAVQQSVLVLADAYYPGWRATFDGSPLEIFPVFHAFRGTVVPPGEHTVEYVYAPLSFRLGLALSCAALLASALYAATQIRTAKRDALTKAPRAHTQT